MSRKGAFWALIILVALILMLYVMESTNWQRGDMVPFGKPIREITAPFQKAANKSSDALKSWRGYFTENESLRQEVIELEKKLDQYTGLLQRQKDIEAENLRLSLALDFKSQHRNQLDLVLAQVVGRDPSNWNQRIILDQGSDDGISVDMAVMTSVGLVGKIIAVTPNTSVVMLMIDPESSVGARIMENRITPGAVQGTGSSQNMQMVHLAHDEEIREGDTVITSGFSQVYPKGIMIGTVTEVIEDPNGLTKKAAIQPFVDFSKLEEVFVVRHVWVEDWSGISESEGLSDDMETEGQQQ